VEIPASVDKACLIPHRVPALPTWMTEQTATLAHQRALLADWLSGADPGALAQALLAWPEQVPTRSLLALARQLPAVRGGGGNSPA
jgi:hypothetical protein